MKMNQAGRSTLRAIVVLLAVTTGCARQADPEPATPAPMNGTPTCLQEAIWRLDVPMTQADFEACLPKVFAALEASIRTIATNAGGEITRPGEHTQNANGKLELLIRYTQGAIIGWLRVSQRKDQGSHL